MKKKTIIVFDEVWMGHVPTYHKIIVGTLLKLGHSVISLSPDPEDVKNWLQQEKITTFSLSAIHFQLNARELEKGFTFFKKLNNYFINLILFLLIKSRLSENTVAKRRKYEQSKLIWQRADELVKSLTINKPNEDILVLLPYIDHKLLVPGITASYIEKHFAFNWVGLHISSIITEQDLWRSNAFKAINCKGLLVLDENLVVPLKQKIKKNVWIFPDVTDESVPSGMSEIEKNILQKAAGRTIISVAGFLTPKKNIILLLKVAALAQQYKLPYFFVFAGHFLHDAWSENELLFLDKSSSEQPENIYLYLNRLNEPELNSIIRSSDIIFAAYRNFNQSSNMLTKATFFNKPVIVSRGYLMEKRVLNFNLGLSVDQDSHEDIINAIKKINTTEWKSAFNANENVEKYYEFNSRQSVNKVIEEILNSV